MEEVDERLERLPLAHTVVGPQLPVPPLVAVGDEQPEQEVQPAGRFPERVALDVEHDVARRGPRQPLEAALGLHGQGPPLEPAARATLCLECRLLAQRVERVRGEMLDPRRGVGLRQTGERRDPGSP